MSNDNPPTPRTYDSNNESSPGKAQTLGSVDPGKLKETLPYDAELDRQLAVWENMDKSLLTTLEEFEKNILWPKGSGDMPKPSRKAIDIATKAIDTLFYLKSGKRRQDISEDAIARTIVDGVINKIALPSNLRAALSQSKYHPTDPTKSKVDAALYPRNVLPTDEAPDWTHLRLFIEFKKGGAENDPFDDESDAPESWAQTRAKVRGQLLAYGSNTFHYQHRIALYSLFINGDEFRAMHWDRSGLVVTMATNYVEDPNSLLRFLVAFANLSTERQGIDPTATLLPKDSEEYMLMDTLALENPALDMPFGEHDDVSQFFDPDAAPAPAPAASAPVDGPAAGTRRKAKQHAQLDAQPAEPVFKYVRDEFRASLTSNWPRYKLLVGVGAAAREFLVAKPVFASTSMFGRGTRGYVAYDVTDHRFVFLKDSWRPFYEGVEPEGNYLRAMASKPGVKLTVPTVVEHGDVLNQTTFVAEYTMAQQLRKAAPSTADTYSGSSRGIKRPREDEDPEDPESEECRTFIHYRIAVEEVCLKMGHFTSGKQLVRLILDCIITHQDAYVNFDLLHRDISTGNMLILPKIQTGRSNKKRVVWHGFLTDWELGKYIPKDKSLQRARQPERTGTWQFMSVAYVRHPERPVVIADELESFFHVLLHHSVRYLRHNVTGEKGGVTQFITHYFDTFQNRNHQSSSIRCSAPKIYAVHYGRIHVDENVLVFHNADGRPPHPLNNLFMQWLLLYNARYRILLKQDSELPPAKDKATISEDDASPQVEHVEDDPDSDFSDHEYGDDSTDVKPQVDWLGPDRNLTSGDTSSSGTAAEPSWPLTHARAAQLEAHTTTIQIFKDLLRSRDWPTDDVVGDQLDASYNPKKQIVALKSVVNSNLASGRVSASASSKKAKLDLSVAAAGSRSGSATRPKSRSRKPTKPQLRARPLKFN